ncbi:MULTISPECIES: hypothetical protein [unclassified Rudaea]|uniref:hypothetical protein n=1 Tax=unclassified Rudaea TaxID=2627037 RepID=UPI0020161E36|nr:MULTISPECIES: hypothetical protein [unclassified Rudaea]
MPAATRASRAQGINVEIEQRAAVSQVIDGSAFARSRIDQPEASSIGRRDVG